MEVQIFAREASEPGSLREPRVRSTIKPAETQPELHSAAWKRCIDLCMTYVTRKEREKDVESALHPSLGASRLF